MKYVACVIVFLFTTNILIDAKRLSKVRSSSRSSSKTQPSPTSLSYPQQPSAPKPTLFGWNEKPAQQSQPSYTSWQSKPSGSQSHSYPSSAGQSTWVAKTPGNQGHSYPSSQTGLSGNNARGTNNQQTQQQSRIPSQSNNHPGHSYPASTGLSGNNGATGGVGYPVQGQGLSGNNGAAGGYPVQGSALSGNNGVAGKAGYPNAGNSMSGAGVAPPPYSGNSNINRPYSSGYPSNNQGNYYHHPQGPPPPYSNQGLTYGGHGGMPGHGFGGYNGYGGHSGYGHGLQPPGYFGNYANYGKGFGNVGRTGSALTGVGIAGAGIGTILTGLALWNLARSTGRHQHTVIYDNRGQPIAVAPNNNTEPAVDPILGDLENCTLTIGNNNSTQILEIPCSIATSFSPEADVKDPSQQNNPNDNTTCTITVVTKAGKEFMTTIPCSTLLNTAAENNVTEPVNTTLKSEDPSIDSMPLTNPPVAEKLSSDDHTANCTINSQENQDPINPCFAITHNLTVIPLPTTGEQTLQSTQSII